MAQYQQPNVKHKRVLLISSDTCPRCSPPNVVGGSATAHLISDHDENKTRMCSKCACVAQDVNREPS